MATRLHTVALASASITLACGRGSVAGFASPDDEPSDMTVGSDSAEDDADRADVPGTGVCDEGRNRYASFVMRYDPTAGGGSYPTRPESNDPTAALGAPDYDVEPRLGSVAIGSGGILELGLGSCDLANGGDEQPDLRVYEAPPLYEKFSVFLHATDPTRRSLAEWAIDEDGWIDAGQVVGTADIDLDDLLPGFGAYSLRFDVVRIVDDPTMGGHHGNAPGADIDAVELLQSVIADD